MINDQELLFVVDENNNPLSPLPRDEVHAKGIWHRVTHIWVLNDQKDILCQKRSLSKDKFPGLWDPFFGGHTGPGSTDIECAIDELEEEIDLKARPEELLHYRIRKDEREKEFQAIFAYRWNGQADKIAYEAEEIDEVEWMPLTGVRKKFMTGSPEWAVRGYEQEMFEWINNL